MILRQTRNARLQILVLLVAVWSLIGVTQASTGDRLPEFRDCVEICKEENCKDGDSVLPLHLRLLLWTCPSECDYTCQHIITDQRLAQILQSTHPVVQYHGKWPFIRFFGIQEPFSVLFSLFNLLAHHQGLRRLRAAIPSSYPLMPYYTALAYLGLAAWTFSMLFHTRDFPLTEKLDYFAAGASVLYGLYYTLIRIFRLDSPRHARVLRLWSLICLGLYTAHVGYLTLWRWDYTYNMAANVFVGTLQNILWTYFSITQYNLTKRWWSAWPGLIVMWIVLAMSLELLDFPPWGGWVDAHALWHLGTVGPTVWWYRWLERDSLQDLGGIGRRRVKG